MANIRLNGEKLEAVSLKSGTRHSCLLSPCLFNILFEVLDRKRKLQKEVKRIQIRKDNAKVSIFIDDMLVYISLSKKSIRELLELKNKFFNVAWHKII